MTLPLVKVGGLAFYQFPGLAAFPGLVHALFTRQGGVSPPPYDGLNVSFSVGDDPERVRENRRRITAALGLSALISAAQVHGATCHIAAGPPPEEDPEAAEAKPSESEGINRISRLRIHRITSSGLTQPGRWMRSFRPAAWI